MIPVILVITQRTTSTVKMIKMILRTVRVDGPEFSTAALAAVAAASLVSCLVTVVPETITLSQYSRKILISRVQPSDQLAHRSLVPKAQIAKLDTESIRG